MTEEQYLLTCLAEECTELAKEALKAVRFGIDNKHPIHGPNRERLCVEFSHLISIAKLLYTYGIDVWGDPKYEKDKKERTLKYIKLYRDKEEHTNDHHQVS